MRLSNVIAIVLVLTTGAASSSHAAQDTTTRGPISFDFHNIKARSCSGEMSLTPWSVDLRLVLSGGCSDTIGLDPRPQATCQDKIGVFEIEFDDGSEPVLAESVASNGENVIFIDTFEPWARSVGELTSVQSISKRSVCRDMARTAAHVPASFCTEARLLAVAFDFNTPLNNRILTNGFSYKIVEGGKPNARYDRDAFATEVRNGFQGALMLWAAALADNNALLTPAVRSFIASRTQTSAGGYKMLVPPQVVPVECDRNATFVIKLEFENSPILPERPLVLARAQIEGRTIALNMAQFKCFRTDRTYPDGKNLRFELEGGCFNLLPILTHELGHALGMTHHDPDPERHALMDPNFFHDALSPRPRDVESLVIALERSLTGARPGELEFMESNGVAPPAGIEEYREP